MCRRFFLAVFAFRRWCRRTDACIERAVAAREEIGMAIGRLDAKFKLSRNRDQADRARVARATRA
jgi:predicted FMN-binding regulatory protein PaiB